jgi:Domain of unknown function (DUF1848).
MMIVSASRRTDIPAYYADWLMGRVAAGYCLVANPFDARRVRRVSLAPEDVDFMVLWTRDPRPLLADGRARLRELEDRGLRFYFQMTIAGYPPEIEPGAPGLAEAIDALCELVDALGPRRVIWRYDPIFIAGSIDADWHRRNFARIAAGLAPRGADGPHPERLVFSLLDEYVQTAGALDRAGFPAAVFGSARDSGARRAEVALRDDGAQRTLFETEAGDGQAAIPSRLPPEPYPALLAELARSARELRLIPLSCAEPYDLSPFGIERGACVDPGLAEAIWPGALSPPEAREGRTRARPAKDTGQRKACHCAPSVDIGAYGTCPRGCAYCYANRGRGRLLARGPWDERL